MRIKSILVKHFLGVEHVEVGLHAPVQLFCGFNKAGKSSTRDAIALALTADLGRVAMKKDIAQLIRAGASSSVCEVVDDDGDVYGVTITASGKMADTQKGKSVDPVLPFVLDGQRFARLDEKARRAFLLGLLQIKMDAASILKRLNDEVGNDPRLARIEPLLRAGFAAAAEEAAQQARQAKANWHAIAGEAYGSSKAAEWSAPRPDFDAGALQAALDLLGQVDQRIGQLQNDLGAYRQRRQVHTDWTQKLATLRGTADFLVRRRDKLARDEAELKTWQEALDAATAKAGTAPRVGLIHELARSVNALLALGVVDRDGVVGKDAATALAAYEDTHGTLNSAEGDSEARARLPQLTSTRDLIASAVRNSMRDLRASEEAAAEIKVLEEQLKTEGTVDGALDQAESELAAARAQRAQTLGVIEAARARKTASESAAKRTADALKAHEDVQAWERIAEALGPSGIPAKILAEALAPINARLAQSAVDAEWAPVLIGADMSVTAGGRAYGLMSESERWRTDAMIAEAIAFISGWRLLVLDRFDVLDLQGRGDCLAWLDAAAQAGEIDCAFLFATLKGMPADLPETVEAHWIDEGKCVELVLEGA